LGSKKATRLIEKLIMAFGEFNMKCPDCGSDDVIPYADGYMCRDCGCEFGTNDYFKKINYLLNDWWGF